MIEFLNNHDPKFFENYYIGKSGQDDVSWSCKIYRDEKHKDMVMLNSDIHDELIDCL